MNPTELKAKRERIDDILYEFVVDLLIDMGYIGKDNPILFLDVSEDLEKLKRELVPHLAIIDKEAELPDGNDWSPFAPEASEMLQDKNYTDAQIDDIKRCFRRVGQKDMLANKFYKSHPLVEE